LKKKVLGPDRRYRKEEGRIRFQQQNLQNREEPNGLGRIEEERSRGITLEPGTLLGEK